MMESSMVGGEQGDVVQAGDLVEAQDQVRPHTILNIPYHTIPTIHGIHGMVETYHSHQHTNRTGLIIVHLFKWCFSGCEAEVIVVDEARANCHSPHSSQGDIFGSFFLLQIVN